MSLYLQYKLYKLLILCGIVFVVCLFYGLVTGRTIQEDLARHRDKDAASRSEAEH